MKALALLTLGLGLARWVMDNQQHRSPILWSWDLGAPSPSTRQWILLIGNTYLPATLSGVAFVFGVAIWFDRASRRPPRGWGGGRWSLAGWAVSMVLQVGFAVLGDAIHRYRISWKTLVADDIFAHVSWKFAGGGFGAAVLTMLGGWIALRIARFPRDPAPDLEEWIGRIVMLLMGLTAMYQLLLFT